MIDRLPQTPGAAMGDIDPRTAYGSPEEIERAEGLSMAEKERLLQRWAELSRADRGSDPHVAEEAERDNDDLNSEAGKA